MEEATNQFTADSSEFLEIADFLDTDDVAHRKRVLFELRGFIAGLMSGREDIIGVELAPGALGTICGMTELEAHECDVSDFITGHIVDTAQEPAPCVDQRTEDMISYTTAGG